MLLLGAPGRVPVRTQGFLTWYPDCVAFFRVIRRYYVEQRKHTHICIYVYIYICMCSKWPKADCVPERFNRAPRPKDVLYGTRAMFILLSSKPA